MIHETKCRGQHRWPEPESVHQVQTEGAPMNEKSFTFLLQ